MGFISTHSHCCPQSIRDVLIANKCRNVIIILNSGEKEEIEIKKIRKCLLIAKINCAIKYVDIRKIAAVIVGE